MTRPMMLAVAAAAVLAVFGAGLAIVTLARKKPETAILVLPRNPNRVDRQLNERPPATEEEYRKKYPFSGPDDVIYVPKEKRHYTYTGRKRLWWHPEKEMWFFGDP